MYICLCRGIREADFFILAMRHGMCPEVLQQAMGLDDSCCGRCEANMEAMLRDISGFLARPSVGSQR